jgi:hypothetical protein
MSLRRDAVHQRISTVIDFELRELTDRMRHDTIDDVAIGALMSSATIPRELSTKMVWNDECVVQGAVFRNRSDSRYDDVARMRRIVDRIIATRVAPTGNEWPHGPHGSMGPAGPRGPQGPLWALASHTAHRAIVALFATALFVVFLFPRSIGALIRTKSERGG